MQSLNLCDYIEAYIHVKRTIEVPNTGSTVAPKHRNKNVIFKNYAPFIICIREINNTQVDDTHDFAEMPIYSLIEYSDIFFKNIRKFIEIL